MSNLQHHKTLCSKCSTLLVSSLNWRPICWWKEPSSCRMPFCVLIFQFKLFCLLQYESPNSHVLKRTQSSSYDCINHLWEVSTLHVEYVHNFLANIDCATTKTGKSPPYSSKVKNEWAFASRAPIQFNGARSDKLFIYPYCENVGFTLYLKVYILVNLRAESGATRRIRWATSVRTRRYRSATLWLWLRYELILMRWHRSMGHRLQLGLGPKDCLR